MSDWLAEFIRDEQRRLKANARKREKYADDLLFSQGSARALEVDTDIPQSIREAYEESLED